MNKRRFAPTAMTAGDGWGSVDDDAYALGAPPGLPFSVGNAVILKPTSHLPRRLRVRYYWMLARPRARLAPGANGADWRNRHRLEAADVLIYETQDGALSGLATVREVRGFRTVLAAVRDVVTVVDKAVTVAADSVPEAMGEDLFLWLVYRLQGEQQLTPSVRLSGIGELSSKDRSLRPSRFSETVTMDRIELAALIALGKVSFGPAKLELDISLPALAADVEIFGDGGFKPLRSSRYDSGRIQGAAQATKLIDDLWVRVLPELQQAYAADNDWQETGRTTLRNAARDQVAALLRIASR